MNVMNVHNFPDLLNEHAYLSQSLTHTQERIARCESEIANRTRFANAKGRKNSNRGKCNKTLRQCRQDELNLIWSLGECVNKIEAFKREQFAREYYAQMAPLWAVPQQEQWVDASSNPAGIQWTADWYIGPLQHTPTEATVSMPVQPQYTISNIFAYPYALPSGDHPAELNAMLPNAPADLTLPAYSPPSLHHTSPSTPSLNPTTPSFTHSSPRSDGLPSLSLSITEPGSILFSNDNEPSAVSSPHEVFSTLRSLSSTHLPTFHRNNKPAPLLHSSILRMKTSALRSPEELISPKTIIRSHRRRHSEEPEPEPETPMKGHKRGAKSELPRALKRIDEQSLELTGSGQVNMVDDITERGEHGNGNGNVVVDTAEGEAYSPSEGGYVGYGVVWNWEGGGTVWPRTPRAVRLGQ